MDAPRGGPAAERQKCRGSGLLLFAGLLFQLFDAVFGEKQKAKHDPEYSHQCDVEER
ncbi:MAG: hypothetical protein OD817_03030 [Gammaproteobacteria bacterium]